MTLGSHLLLLATSSDHFKIARHANNVLPAEVKFEAITSDPLRHQTCQHKDTPGPVEASADPVSANRRKPRVPVSIWRGLHLWWTDFTGTNVIYIVYLF